MSFDVTRTDQCAKTETNFRRNLYSKLNDWSKKTEWVRLSGFFVGVISGISNIIRRIACVVECIFKAIANIFGSLVFCENCKFLTGLVQIGYGAGHLICLPLTIFRAIFPLVTSTVGIFIVPGRYTKFCADYYDLTTEEIKGRRKSNFLMIVNLDTEESLNDKTPNNEKDSRIVNYLLT